MMYEEEDFLSLSGIQHFEFCRRQWALIHIEQQWADNLRTVEGELFHSKAHDGSVAEKRGGLIISRGMAVYSRTLGINGVCDIVEFQKDETGIELYGRKGKYKVYPVEYKKGEPKTNDIDILQLVAQIMCLEEMICCSIDTGYLYYGETRHRIKITVDKGMREKVTNIFEEMHDMYSRRYTPKVKMTKSCNACSLKDICIPKLCKNKSAKKYIETLIAEVDDQ
ncbi:CRISPR-associated protein Cas4 [Anaerocolumna aminovalerica]|jgi:CRISPR-associated exonuclease Cas4|uniref:CRISPR-associated protein Cas4 n=1 Tax=Anaerocolumna aminovalerica TaxID=1527 RepID=UPI00248B3EBA|nr:CRISPR-associated protein Cas4 [Anaerocolumna aminovalerica]